jgi:hypothetical protein
LFYRSLLAHNGLQPFFPGFVWCNSFSVPTGQNISCFPTITTTQQKQTKSVKSFQHSFSPGVFPANNRILVNVDFNEESKTPPLAEPVLKD